jgi:uncharacterized protein YbjQ (UPF0145 family)
MDFVINLLFAVVLLTVWWAIGRVQEKEHLADLARREAAVKDFEISTLRAPADATDDPARPPVLVMGDAVIASDGFKTWTFGLRNLIGGESKTFVRLYDRSRREALLRMIESAKALGYDAVCNVRFGTADIAGNATASSGQKSRPMSSCTATGTAYHKAVHA